MSGLIERCVVYPLAILAGVVVMLLFFVPRIVGYLAALGAGVFMLCALISFLAWLSWREPLYWSTFGRIGGMALLFLLVTIVCLHGPALIAHWFEKET
jgi:hypothetical protein